MYNIKETLQSYLGDYVSSLKSLTPVRTGALRDSIYGSIKNDTIEIVALDYFVYVDGKEAKITSNANPTFEELANELALSLLEKLDLNNI